MLFGRDCGSAGTARTRAAHTWPAIAGFAGGAAAGAALYAAVGIESLALPLGMALVAVGLPGPMHTHHSREPHVNARSVAVRVDEDGDEHAPNAKT